MTQGTHIFTGRGWAWPVAAGGSGGFLMVSDEAAVEQSIFLILSTTPGERPMRPEFGCRLQEYVFAPADATTAGLVAAEVAASLRRWEPRITIDRVEVEVDQDNAMLLIDVAYFITDSYDRRNLVFPFYMIPGDE